MKSRVYSAVLKQVLRAALGCLLFACASVPPRDIPTLRVALEEIVSADESPTGLPETHTGEVVRLDLETYLGRVLAGEVPANWPLEALKAQGVASRSYALFLKHSPRSPDYDILSSIHDQVFRPTAPVPRSLKTAVRETTGEALFANGQPLQAFFHSCCGGATERPVDVWPSASGHPLQVSVPDPYDTDCPDYRWAYHLSKVELLVLFSEAGLKIADFSDIVPSRLTKTGRVETFRFVGSHRHTDLGANELRRIVGYRELKSTNFRMEEEGMEIEFRGQGSGHGVGLCQWGARGMALAGFTYDQILAHFYPGAELRQAY